MYELLSGVLPDQLTQAPISDLINYLSAVFSPNQAIPSGVFTLVLGVLIKYWLNGTRNELKELKRDKVDNKVCILKEEKYETSLNNMLFRMNELREDQKEIKNDIKELHHCLTRQVRWDGHERRKD